MKNRETTEKCAREKRNDTVMVKREERVFPGFLVDETKSSAKVEGWVQIPYGEVHEM